ncbi:MAG: hypothetical protein ACYCT7_07800 [bacterium]
MQNTLDIYEKLRKNFDEDQAKNLTLIFAQIYKDLANIYIKVEYRELVNMFFDYVEAQNRNNM